MDYLEIQISTIALLMRQSVSQLNPVATAPGSVFVRPRSSGNA